MQFHYTFQDMQTKYNLNKYLREPLNRLSNQIIANKSWIPGIALELRARRDMIRQGKYLFRATYQLR